jgi:glyoxylase I family protein
VAIDIRGICPLLQVFDMPTSLAFYQNVLGFELVTSSAPAPNCDWAWLKFKDGELMLNTAYERDQRPAGPDPKRIAAYDDTCLYFGAPDVDAVYAHLREKGIALKPPSVAPYGMKQLYLYDPDGYNLCFQWQATEEEKKARQRQAN